MTGRGAIVAAAATVILAASLSTQAQQVARIAQIGYLTTGSAGSDDLALGAFREGYVISDMSKDGTS